MGRTGQALRAATLSAAVLAPTAQACGPGPAPRAGVPSWAAVNGFSLGSRPATPAELDRYLLAVDRASPRVRTFLAGRSAQGRPIRYAAVAHPRVLDRLEHVAAGLRAARAGALPRARADALARSAPVFAWLGASVHGNEPSGADADMRVLRGLATARRCAAVGRLRRVVTFVLPVQNPDGRAVGARANAHGFDLNRDWFARTQPETRATIRALRRFPPVVLADQHEEAGTGFFFPPNADPVHHEVPPHALRAIARVLAPRLRGAFRAHRVDFVDRATYDLFFMGFGDTASATLLGAAGMTFEKGAASPYRERTREHHLAARALLSASADARGALLRGWTRGWRAARAQGRRGALTPNRVLEPGAEVRFPVPDGPVHGHVLHGGDATALARRLAAVGLRVRRLAAPARLTLRGFGEREAVPTTVPAGAYVVPAAQPGRRWAQAMLGDDPYAPVAEFYDVASWSNPLLMGVRGGALAAAPAARTAPLRPSSEAAEAPAHRFPGGAEASARLAFALLREGRRVVRTADGAFAAEGPAAPDDARRLGVTVAPLAAMPEGRPLRRPRVAVLADPARGPSAAWARWLLAERFDLPVAVVDGAGLATGALGDRDALVVPDGAATADDLTPAALAAVRTFATNGGTVVAWRRRGLAVARAAGLTRVRERDAPGDLTLPGNLLRVALDPASEVGAGEHAEGFAFNAGDPVLAAGGAPVVARYPADERFFVSGYAAGTAALRGTPAATDEAAGAGRLVLFAFDPAFRGYAEGTQRLVANALLAPPRAASRAGGRAPGRIDPAALAAAAPRPAGVVRVGLGDEAALRAAAAAAGLPGDVERDLAWVTLRVAASPDAPPSPAGRAVVAALRAAGVRPLLVVL